MADFNDKTVYILDSYGLIFRCYFAFINRPLINNRGENISALFGFFRNLHFILEHYKPGYLIAAMDSKTKTFRHEMYDQYKATRPKTPEDLHAQIPWIEEILKELGVPVLQCDGYEADDIIATVAKKCQDSGRTCRILSGDKDLMQLVNDSIQILKPENGGGWKVTDASGVQAEWGVTPEQLLDLLSLYGDTADNVPGVKGIGVKTADTLLIQYKNLDGIYEHIDEIKGAVQKKLIEGKENAYFSQKLITLCNTVPCSDIDKVIDSPKHTFDLQKAALALKKYGALAVAKQYAADETVLGNTATNTNATGKNNTTAAEPTQGTLFSENDAATGKNSSTTTNAADDTTIVSAEPVAVPNKGNYTGITDNAALKSYIDGFFQEAEKSNCYEIAFDCETTGLDTITSKIVGFSLSYKKGEGIYVPLQTGESDLFSQNDYIEKKAAFAQLDRLFSNASVSVIFHNAKFDLKILATNGLFENLNQIKAKIQDTMIAAWLLNPERDGKNAFSLETLGKTRLGLIGIEFNDIVPKGQNFSDIELEKAVPYAAEDADFTFQLWQIFKKELEQKGFQKLYDDVEIKLLPILAQMELTGIHLDSAVLNDYNIELTQKLESVEKKIFAEVGHEFNISSPKQLQTVLFEERGLKPGKKTKTGYSTDTSVLEELAYTDIVPKMILEYRELAKLQSTYVQTLPKLADKNGRIHTDFVQTGTATGRLSCREPNLQNIPVRNEAGRKIRSAFTAPQGKVLISADYSQIELVVLAHLSQDENMCRAFREGTDVHKATAALIYGVPAESVTPDMRRTAKTINFGVIYGMSAFRLAQDLGISRTQASNFISSYFQTYEKINAFINNTISEAEKTGSVKTIFGRQRQIININSRNKIEKSAAERMAVNSPVQGSAADIVKKAMLDVSNALAEKNNGAKLLLQVHDELILECPDEPAVIDETISLIRQKMENAVELSVPLRVSIEYGKNWGEFH